MFEALRRLLNEAATRQTTVSAGEEEIRLAAAALLFHVIAVDGIVTEGERAMLKELLARRFSLDAAAAASLVMAAEDAEAEAVDLYSFTHVLKAALEVGDRERIIEMMWKLSMPTARCTSSRTTRCGGWPNCSACRRRRASG